MFKTRHNLGSPTVTITIEGREVAVPAGVTVAAAVLGPGKLSYTRTTPVSGSPRAPYCAMGVCFECLMEIDGVPNRQSCMVEVRDGMTVFRQHGKRTLPE